MILLKNIKNSLYNPRYYAVLKEGTLSSSFRYYFSLIAVLSVVTAFIFGVELSPVFSAANLRKLVNFFPKELSIQIQSGVISTNVTEPYIIRGSLDDVTLNKQQEGKQKNLIVIDTKTTSTNFSADTFWKYDTKVLIGRNFVVTTKNPSQFEFNDLSKIPDFSLNQARLFHWVDLLAQKHLLISLGIFVLLLLAFLMFFSAKLMGLLIIALIILLVVKWRKIPLSFKNCYQISLHAVTVSLILQTIFIISNISVPIPFFFSLIVLIIAFINIKKLESDLPQNSVA